MAPGVTHLQVILVRPRQKEREGEITMHDAYCVNLMA